MTRSYLGYVSSQTTSVLPVSTYGVATGGTSSSITVDGQAYTLLTFTSSGTLTVSSAGLFDVLLFAGGAGGGPNSASDTNRSGGGGGAGGALQATVYLSANQTVTIGAGGAGGNSGTENHAKLGSSSSIGSALGISVAGGGTPAYQLSNQSLTEPDSGGCGGGGTNYTLARLRDGAASMAPSVSGFAGGNGANSTAQGQGAGGGGGATAVGSNASTTTGGAGGAGYDVSAFIAGSALYKAGGGGGGGTTGGAGGSSVGGAGGGAGVAGSSASANTGGGGGGAGYSTGANANGGSGGSGIVYVRFKV